MARMIKARHTGRCPYGCCASGSDLVKASWAGTHRRAAKQAIKRAMKKRDRQRAFKDELDI